MPHFEVFFPAALHTALHTALRITPAACREDTMDAELMTWVSGDLMHMGWAAASGEGLFACCSRESPTCGQKTLILCCTLAQTLINAPLHNCI